MSLIDNDPKPTPKFDDLVGDGKKYKNNDELVAALMEKDNLINDLSTKTKSFETDLRARKNLEDLVAELQASKPSGEIVEPNRQEPGSEGKEPKLDLAAEVMKILQAERSRENREGNINAAKAKLKELYGSNYGKTLEEVATSLDVSTNFLEDLAARSPEGLVKVVTGTAKPVNKVDVVAPPQNRIDISRNPSTSVRKNAAYYRDLRKSDLNLYMDKRTQAEMHREAMEQGPAFFQ